MEGGWFSKEGRWFSKEGGWLSKEGGWFSKEGGLGMGRQLRRTAPCMHPRGCWSRENGDRPNCALCTGAGAFHPHHCAGLAAQGSGPSSSERPRHPQSFCAQTT
jgi:hypothetical protein